MLERGDADAGTCATPKTRRDLLGRKPEPFERAEGGADRKRKLRARAEPRMRRDLLFHLDHVAAIQANALDDCFEITLGAKRAEATGADRRRWLDAQSRARAIEREPERAERACSPSAWIEKAEMQPRRGGYRHAGEGHAASLCLKVQHGRLH